MGSYRYMKKPVHHFLLVPRPPLLPPWTDPPFPVVPRAGAGRAAQDPRGYCPGVSAGLPQVVGQGRDRQEVLAVQFRGRTMGLKN